MTMIRCDADKHYYDPQSNDSCPYCGVEDEFTRDMPNLFNDTAMNSDAATEYMSAPNTVGGPMKTEAINNFNAQRTVALDRDDPTMMINDDPTVIVNRDNQPQSNQTKPFVDNGGGVKTQIFGFPEQMTHTADSADINKLPVAGWLVVIDGAGKGQDFRLIQGENRVGRGSDNEVCLDFDSQSDEMISRDSHVVVVYDNHANEFFAEKGRSRNLPMLNGKTIRNGVDVITGDVIQIGETKLMLVALCNANFTWQ